MQRLGPYQLLEELARGGQGAVYRARRDGAPVEVALKVLYADVFGQDEVRLQRFLREAQALARLRHPGIVPLQDSGEHAGTRYLVVQLVPGGQTLADAVERGPLEPATALDLTRQLAEALVHAHAAGILHRDLKPANVLLDPDGRARLTDFGLARDLDPEGPTASLTVSGICLGTPGYWAPELARGQRDRVGPRTDVYGLGAILFALLTGEPPQGESASFADAALAVGRPPRPPSSLVPDVPPALDALVLKCLAVEPEDRYPSMSALLAALDEITRSPAPPAGSRAPHALIAGAILLLGLLGAASLLREVGEPAAIPARPPTAPTQANASPTAPAAASPSATAPTAANASPTAPGPASGSSAEPAPADPSAPRSPAIGTHELVLQPDGLEGCDSYIRAVGFYLNDNYGCDDAMRVGSRTSGAQGFYRAYLRFELERLPADAEVEAATLALHVSSSFPAEPMAVCAWPVAASWVEGTSTNDDDLDGICALGELPAGNPRRGDRAIDSGRPEFSGPDYVTAAGPLDRVEVTQTHGPGVTLDVTRAVRAWRRGEPNHGLCLTTEERQPLSGLQLSFASSDAQDPARRPRLTIRYRGRPPGPDHAAARRAEAEREQDALIERFYGAGPRSNKELITQAHAIVAAAPHRARGFEVRARLYQALAEEGDLSCLHRALRDMRLALARATSDAVPALRERALAILEHLLALDPPLGGADRVDEQLYLLQALAWDELRALRDRVQAVVPQPRLWLEQQ